MLVGTKDTNKRIYGTMESEMGKDITPHPPPGLGTALNIYIYITLDITYDQ